MSIAVADVIERLSSLPPFPRVTAKLLTLLNDPDVTVDEFSDVISTDPALVLKVIQLANSPFYMVTERIESVRRAIFVLGLQTIKTITTAAAIHRGFLGYMPRGDHFDFDAFWKHSYATAIAAGKLAESHGRNEKDKMYLTGLIHDIGKIILAYHWPESWKQVIVRVENTDETYEEIEPQLFSSTHTELAAILCSSWQFPEDIVNMVRYHHRPEDAPEKYTANCVILHNALIVTTARGFDYPDQTPREPSIDSAEYEALEAVIGDLEGQVQYQLKSFGA